MNKNIRLRTKLMHGERLACNKEATYQIKKKKTNEEKKSLLC